MNTRINISCEERFLQNLIFSNWVPELGEIQDLNFEELIKLTSYHLLIPLFYFTIKEKKIQLFLPQDFFIYTEEIYKINLNRNQEMINEMQCLSKLLKKNSINYKLLKGGYLLSKNYYKDLGIRMIGDIDFLISINDLKKTINLLNSIGYFSKFKYKLWKTKHTPRFINKEKLYAIEPHTEILIYRWRKIINSQKILSKKKLANDDLRKILILNYMINDYGSLKATMSYRSLYDVLILGIKISNFEFLITNKHIKRFYIMSNCLKITNYKIQLNFWDNFFKTRFILKKNTRTFYIIDNFICRIIELTPIFVMQFVEFIINNQYRKNAISIIKKLFNLKKIFKN